MKKLSKLVLNDHSSIMNDRDMKRIVGGDQLIPPCAARKHWQDPITCFNNHDINGAMDYANSGGNEGWWCCNCQEAIATCGYVYSYE